MANNMEGYEMILMIVGAAVFAVGCFFGAVFVEVGRIYERRK